MPLTDIIGNHRDHFLEDRAVAYLLTLDENAREAELCEYLKSGNVAIGLSFIRRSHLGPAALARFLEYGLLSSDISQTRHWIKATAPNLGLAKVRAVVEKVSEISPSVRENAMYWLIGDRYK